MVPAGKAYLLVAVFASSVRRSLCASANNVCLLETLSLRFKDSPINLVPPFVPTVFSYAATLDFVMDGFSVDVRAAPGCEVDQAPNQAIPVQVGSSHQLTVFAKNPKTGARQAYIFKATRLLGSETELQKLTVDGGQLSPQFDPAIRSYKVRLSLTNDVVKVWYTQRDAGQRSNVVASGEAFPNTNAAGKRLLLATGEVQYINRYKEFVIDVGFTRTITITVESSDATQANIGTYKLETTRDGCNPAKPYYDPTTLRCVNNCPSAYYRNPRIHRCSECNTNCLVCTGLLTCQMCKPNTIDNTYVLQTDGSCAQNPNRILEKYWWWCVGLAVFAGLIMLLGLGALCQYCCCARRRNVVHSYESESEDSDTDLRNLVLQRKGMPRL